MTNNPCHKDQLNSLRRIEGQMRGIQKMTVFVLVLFLSFVSIFCCCLTDTAKAELHYKAEQVEADGNRCCSPKTNNSDSKKHKECDCEKVAGILVNEGLYISNFRSSFIICSAKTVSLSAQEIISSMEDMHNHVFRVSNQIVKNDPPIYLLDSVLRI
ncbi:MAG: metal-sensing transcriptional repressor [Candidatus Omnitrophica bacterium]|nr:metal-sensing transcriptional repressor [Candidatus Omnitrophota bacterium]MBU1996827.1 metal-sensing transcriptional repressor [Candidatus Omnitrophota bacterium]MBU4334089.1 metal-sensing transcriptional repressor [Candidatus Omnitrophota bacterium]